MKQKTGKNSQYLSCLGVLSGSPKHLNITNYLSYRNNETNQTTGE